ncbi:MAG: DUF2934 domain-containing protein [Betaproteobacteria bacterium]|nr:DUF2934 domain-containing protein [Betaproteobacteria bacterium]
MSKTSSQPNKTSIQENSGVKRNIQGDRMDRNEMIAVAAYYRAEHRGFANGNSMEDWLAAEAEIDALLAYLEEPGIR